MKTAFKIFINTFLFVVLTILTQVGGIILLFTILICWKWHIRFKLKKVVVFTATYCICTFAFISFVAPLFGREKIKTSENLKPATVLTILMNRNYVKPALNELLQDISKNRSLRFLDANFPFIDHFPLLPHLSHNDGRKIDLSFIYENKNGQITDKIKSISGYGVFEAPSANEHNQIAVCKSSGYFQYDYPKHLTLGRINQELQFSQSANKDLINKLVEKPLIEKVFVEPHLVTRLNLTSDKIRYHGCRAVRHDDHIHIQIR